MEPLILRTLQRFVIILGLFKLVETTFYPQLEKHHNIIKRFLFSPANLDGYMFLGYLFLY